MRRSLAAPAGRALLAVAQRWSDNDAAKVAWAKSLLPAGPPSSPRELWRKKTPAAASRLGLPLLYTRRGLGWPGAAPSPEKGLEALDGLDVDAATAGVVRGDGELPLLLAPVEDQSGASGSSLETRLPPDLKMFTLDDIERPTAAGSGLRVRGMASGRQAPHL